MISKITNQNHEIEIDLVEDKVSEDLRTHLHERLYTRNPLTAKCVIMWHGLLIDHY